MDRSSEKVFSTMENLFKLNNLLKGDLYTDSYNESLARINYFKIL